jgi:hypothetical protein
MMLLTKENRAALPKLYSQEKESDPMCFVKFFSPTNGSTWYITEFDGEDTMFGFARLNDWNDMAELGYISLSELASIKLSFGLRIERDMHWKPKRLSECKKELGISAVEEWARNHGSR